jgi:exodeoxyribonuclease V alpha subunit
MKYRINAGTPSPAQTLAEGFARHVEHWARGTPCDAAGLHLLRQAAFELSLATSNGQVCLALAELCTLLAPVTDITALRRVLLGSGVVGTPESPGAMPLILDGEGRLYLHRYYDYERRLALRLMRAAAAPPYRVDATTQARVNALFQVNEARLGGRLDWQKLAAALALRQRLTVISGGPGTGKTSTVLNLLACLIEQDPGTRIALAAPTGKAAARLSETVRLRAAQLPPALRERLPAESFTIHRLLGVTPARGGFVHHAGNRLAIDALVVDEASMLDLALATKLLEAVPDTARIILLGDKDQLAAVEAGAVFAELSADPSLSEACVRELARLCGVPALHIIAPAPARPGALRDTAAWFTHNFRFEQDSGIAHLARDINNGRAPQAVAWLRAGASDALRWLDDDGATLDDATLRHMQTGYAAYFDAVRRESDAHAAIVQAFGAFRVLCAVREGARGMLAVNEHLTRHARQVLSPQFATSKVDPRSPWYPGRPVMLLRNDYVLRLFNGDIGITLPDDSGELLVYFPDAAGGLRAVAPLRLPEHQTAFAMTVHKSQGSEFDEVLVLLPQQRSRVLTRELLYTAVTRARHRVLLSGSAQVLAAAIESPTQRHCGLPARLREAATQLASPGSP